MSVQMQYLDVVDPQAPADPTSFCDYFRLTGNDERLELNSYGRRVSFPPINTIFTEEVGTPRDVG